MFEIVQTGLVTGVAFETFVYSFSEPEALTRIYYGWFFVAVMCAVVSVAVQGFFAWRIWVLAKWQWKSWIVGGIEAVRAARSDRALMYADGTARSLRRYLCYKGSLELSSVHW